MLAVALTRSVDIEPKLSMIRLLQNHRHEDYEDWTVANMIWHVLLLYRPQSDIGISWAQRRAAIMKLFSMILPFFANDNPYRADIIHITISLCYEQEVLQYLLRTTKGYIDRKPGTSSTLHEALHRRLLDRDPSSMRLIVGKTKDLHRLAARSYLDPRPETPTMLAMYDMRTFLAWRNMLHDLGVETLAFVEQELSKSSLRDFGWSSSSLRELFDTEIFPDPYYGPNIFGFPNCERCGDSGTMCFRMLKVDLVWRRYLRNVRVNHSTKGPEDGVEHSTAFSIKESAGSSIWKRELPYRIVCSTECTDGVCVAWFYEDDINAEPEFPPYPSKVPSDFDNEKDQAIIELDEEEPCPTKNMPGAFKDS